MESCFKRPKNNFMTLGYPTSISFTNQCVDGYSVTAPHKTNMESKNDTFQKRNLLFQQTPLFQVNHVKFSGVCTIIIASSPLRAFNITLFGFLPSLSSEQRKKTALLSIKYWLFNRDPFHGL